MTKKQRLGCLIPLGVFLLPFLFLLGTTIYLEGGDALTYWSDTQRFQWKQEEIKADDGTIFLHKYKATPMGGFPDSHAKVNHKLYYNEILFFEKETSHRKLVISSVQSDSGVTTFNVDDYETQIIAGNPPTLYYVRQCFIIGKDGTRMEFIGNEEWFPSPTPLPTPPKLWPQYGGVPPSFAPKPP